MRTLIALIAVLTTAFIQEGSLRAQQIPINTRPSSDCSTSTADEPTGPEISIEEVTFSGPLLMPLSDQEAIADEVKLKTHGTSLENVMEEGLERAIYGWQDHGYFKAELTDKAKTLTSDPVNLRIALDINVNEGVQYRLRSIKFQHNKAITSTEILRGAFPIADGDIFSREKIGQGLEILRKTYGELGYLNFTASQGTKIDDANQLISLVIDFDEGKQFRVGKIKVLGLDESAQEDFLKTFPIRPGQILSSKVWEESLLKYPDCPCREQQRLDNQTGFVTLTLDFRPCPPE
jgi:outer membrane protein assembly factor BamA